MLFDLINSLANSPAFAPLRQGFQAGARRQWLSGVRGTGKSLLIAALISCAQETMGTKSHFLLTPSQERAENLFNDLCNLFDETLKPSIVLFPSLESLLFEETSPDTQLRRERMNILARLIAGEELIIIATPDAALHRTLPPQVLKEASFSIRIGDTIDPVALTHSLIKLGYQHEGLVEQPGQFSLRGGILDVFPSTELQPFRLEFFGDEIDSLRYFDPATQRSAENATQCHLSPACEMLLLPERAADAEVRISDALEQQMAIISQEAVKLPGDDGKTDEFLSPAERLTVKISREIDFLQQGIGFNGQEYYLPYLYPEGATLLDYLADNCAVILDEPEHIALAFDRFQQGLHTLAASRINRGALLPTPHPLYLPLNDGLQFLAKYSEVAITLLPPGLDASFTNPLIKSLEELLPDAISNPNQQSPLEIDGANISIMTQSPVNYAHLYEQFQGDLRNWLAEEYLLIAATHQERRLAEMLTESAFPVNHSKIDKTAITPGMVNIRRVDLGEGTIIPAAKIALLTDGEIFGWQKQRRTQRKSISQGQVIANLNQLLPGNFVVHINHGIGKYIGLVRREIQGVEREFLQIDYAGADKLFVPIDQLDRVQKYLTLADDNPEIHRLGSGDWERIKRRTKKSTEELAKQLLVLQAKRSRETGHAFAPDSPWQREMEEGFPWLETPDQMTAIEQVKVDMEAEQPMDRLVCGDVGFGKTEVAIRAAFKAVMDGKQVAVLAPTTVLAAQHYRTFSERMAAYPVRIELLSRSISKRDQLRIVADVNGGAVDIIIGTHRILSKDVTPSNLGLVIIDEEQRFGVKQKERFKHMAANIDILTMSATPIPRTLHMALSGLREMSVINTPPEGRMPVRTMAMEADDEVLREAILREIDRDGQVFILHNRIASIYHVAEHIRNVAPQARIAVAHGQMAEGELDRLMMEFYQRKYDVLVCTAIIENGIDLPNVNTLIVDQAEIFGLAQLYQLRGRVGRSDRQAYAYLTWKPHKRLTETAQERIAALKEFSMLGAGYKVALRDLEIRGAGNLLGAEQSGVLAAVGYDLYCQMLEDAVKMVRGEYLEPEREIQIDLPLDAFIPADYVPDLNQRIDIYRRLAAVREDKYAKEIRDEFLDRFGKPLPSEVDNLFRLISIKLTCLATGITHIASERDAIVLRISTNNTLSPQAVKKLTMEAQIWRKRGMSAPAYTPDRATIYTFGLSPEDKLMMLEEVAQRLRSIEEEVSRAPRPSMATTTIKHNTLRRPFGGR